MAVIIRALSVLLVAGTMLSLPPSTLWAGTETPTPGALGIPVNPNASGTKLSGPLTIFYDVVDVSPATCTSGVQITKFSVVMTLSQGNTLATFSDESTQSICFLEVAPQVTLVQNLIAARVIPFFFPGNPTASFEFKDVSSISPTVTSTATSFAVGLNVTIAVH